MGKLIVIEGLDGSGKATQSALMERALHARGRDVRMVSFPDYGSTSSALVKMYLAGTFGAADDVNPYAASSFYAVDRYASWKSDWGLFLDKPDSILIADRYTTSNAIHQCAKLPPEEWKGYAQWLWEYEYTKLGIPAPDSVIYLDVSIDVSRELLKKRYGDENKLDIHESDEVHLQNSRKAAHWCVEEFGWQFVVCDQDGRMRSQEEISAELMGYIDTIL